MCDEAGELFYLMSQVGNRLGDIEKERDEARRIARVLYKYYKSQEVVDWIETHVGYEPQREAKRELPWL